MAFVQPKLSYQLVGLSYKVHNSLGYGHQEKVYQNAYEQELIQNDIHYQREVYVPLQYNNTTIGKGFLDFLIEEKIIVELKIAPSIIPIHLRQVLEYLRITTHELAIILLFTPKGVSYKRILNSHKIRH